MNQSPSFLLPVDESSQRQSTPQYGNGANTSTPTTSFRYLEAMVVRSGAEAGRVKTGPQAPLLIEPVVIPRIGNIDVEQVTRLDSKGLFYPNGSKGANLQRMVMAKINDSGMERQTDKKEDTGGRNGTAGASRSGARSRSPSRPTMYGSSSSSSSSLLPRAEPTINNSSSSHSHSSHNNNKSLARQKTHPHHHRHHNPFLHSGSSKRSSGAAMMTSSSRPPLFYSKKRDPAVDRMISSLRDLEEHMDIATGVKT